MLGWIVFTIVIAGLIGAPFLYWRSVRQRLKAAEQITFGSYGGIDRSSNPFWQNPALSPESEARTRAFIDEPEQSYVGDALPGLRLVYPYGGAMTTTQKDIRPQGRPIREGLGSSPVRAMRPMTSEHSR